MCTTINRTLVPTTGIYPSTFTNVHFLNEDWVFEFCKVQVGVLRCCKLCNGIMMEPWWEQISSLDLLWGSRFPQNQNCKFLGKNPQVHPPPLPLKHFDLFISRGQINSLKQKKHSKFIYFKCKSNTNLF